jgi:hypothetical protein
MKLFFNLVIMVLHAITFIPNASQNKRIVTSILWTIVDSNASTIKTVHVFK